MINLFKNTFRYILLRMLKYIPWTQEMCSEVVQIEPWSLAFVPGHFKTQEMCSQAVEKDSHTPRYAPVHLRTQEMCIKAVEKIYTPWNLFQIILSPDRCVKELLKINQGP